MEGEGWQERTGDQMQTNLVIDIKGFGLFLRRRGKEEISAKELVVRCSLQKIASCHIERGWQGETPGADQVGGCWSSPGRGLVTPARGTETDRWTDRRAL